MTRPGGLSATGALPPPACPGRSWPPCSREASTAVHASDNATPSRFSSSGLLPRPSASRRDGSRQSVTRPGEAAFGAARFDPDRSVRHFPSGQTVSLQSDRAFALSHRNETARIPKGSIVFRQTGRSPSCRKAATHRLSIRFSGRRSSPRRNPHPLCRLGAAPRPPIPAPIRNIRRISAAQAPTCGEPIASHRENPVPSPHFLGSSTYVPDLRCAASVTSPDLVKAGNAV